MRGTYAAVRRALSGRAKADGSRRLLDPVTVELTLDGAGLVNWRSPRADVQALVLDRSGGNEAMDSPRLLAHGPPHGRLQLRDLGTVSHRVRARTALGLHDLYYRGASDSGAIGNEGRPGDGSVWTVEPESDGVKLMRRTFEDVRPSVLGIEAGHGIVSLRMGSLAGPSVLQVARRGRLGTMFEVPTRQDPQRPGQHVVHLGADQWRQADLREDDGISAWNLYVLAAEGTARTRLTWGASTLKEPRSALRFRSSTAHGLTGISVRVRPYWTRDEFLALELEATRSIEGAVE